MLRSPRALLGLGHRPTRLSARLSRVHRVLLGRSGSTGSAASASGSGRVDRRETAFPPSMPRARPASAWPRRKRGRPSRCRTARRPNALIGLILLPYLAESSPRCRRSPTSDTVNKTGNFDIVLMRCRRYDSEREQARDAGGDAGFSMRVGRRDGQAGDMLGEDGQAASLTSAKPPSIVDHLGRRPFRCDRSRARRRGSST